MSEELKRKLGRLPEWDDRNLKHLMPKKAPDPQLRSVFWNPVEIYDQGNTSECVGYAGYGWLVGGPVYNKPKFTPTELYHWAQANDQWEGENYEGTSTLGLMKSLKDKGYINSYVWALDAQTVVNWVLTTGPVVVGTWWYTNMFYPKGPDYFLDVNGQPEGGHEWRIFGVDLDIKCPDGTFGAVRMANSWGYGWGDRGQAWISIKNLDWLIKNEGDAVTALEFLIEDKVVPVDPIPVPINPEPLPPEPEPVDPEPVPEPVEPIEPGPVVPDPEPEPQPEPEPYYPPKPKNWLERLIEWFWSLFRL